MVCADWKGARKEGYLHMPCPSARALGLSESEAVVRASESKAEMVVTDMSTCHLPLHVACVCNVLLGGMSVCRQELNLPALPV